MQIIRAAVALVLAICATGAAAQQPFHAGVDLVALDVCVRSRHGHDPAELTAQDFVVVDNSIRQSIVLFSGERRLPLAVSLLVDSSQSMHDGLLEHARGAAAALIDALRPQDLVEVVSFSDHANVRYGLGPDHEAAKRTLGEMTAFGGTALFESILVGLHNQERARQGQTEEYRRVMVVLSDGDNTAGRTSFDDALERVRHGGTLVYTVTLPHPERGRTAAPTWQMAQLAFDSGGDAMTAHRADQLTGIYQAIAEDLLHLYRVGYVPTPLARDGSWHRVSVMTPATDVIVRTRSGYYAP